MAKIELLDEQPLNIAMSEPQTINETITPPENINVETTDGWYEKEYTETDPIYSISAASTITEQDIESWNNKSDFSGDYNDLENKPIIPEVPTKTSDLVNDSGFLTEHQDISGKVDKVNGKELSTNDFTDTYKSNVDSNTTARHTHSNKSVLDDISSSDVSNWNSKQETLVSGTNIKTINNESILGSGNITIQGGGTGNGDMLKSVYDTNDNGIVDNAEKVNNHTVEKDVPSNAVFTDTTYESKTASSGGTDVSLVTIGEKYTWNNKSDFSGNYNDLSNKPTIPSEVTETTVSNWGFTKNTGTYSKPSGGIPKTDLASAVQTSLGKADTALQSYTETDPVFSASASASITSSDITSWNSKSEFSGSYTDLTDKPTIPTVPTALSSFTDDLGSSPTHTHSQYLTSHQDISGKVDKETGKGLSSNDFTTTYKNNVDSNTSARHTHSNKTVLDGISSSDITNWNNKSTFSGDYDDLTNKPTIPNKTSDITNDSGFITATNYASNQNGGTIKTDTSTYGTSMYSGYLTGSTRTYEQYNNAANALFVSKGTLENVITGKGLVSNNDLSAVATSGSYTDLTNKPTIPTNNNQLANGAGYITGITSSDVTTALGYIPEQKEMFWLNSTFAYDLSDLESITSTSDDLFIDIKDAIDNEKSFEIKTNDGLTGDVAFVKAVNCEHLARYNTRPESYSFWYMVDDTLYKIQFTINGTSVTTTTTSYSKQDSLISGTNIKTINNTSLLGSGDISFETIQEISGESSIRISNLDAGIYKIYGETYGTDVYYNSNDSLSVRDQSYSYLIVTVDYDLYTVKNWVYIGNFQNDFCYGYSWNSNGYCYNVTSAEAQEAITGILSNLTTTAKTNLVSAINELDSDKQETLVSGTNIKTINNQSILGSGNINISGGATKTIMQAVKTSDTTNYSTSYNYFSPFNGDGDASTNISIGSGLTFETKTIAFGDRTSHSVYGITVGTGISIIKVYYSTRYLNNHTANVGVNSNIYRVRSNTADIMYGTTTTMPTNTRTTLTGEHYIEVQEGDFIFIGGYRTLKTSDVDVISTNNATSMYVEVIQ